MGGPTSSQVGQAGVEGVASECPFPLFGYYFYEGEFEVISRSKRTELTVIPLVDHNSQPLKPTRLKKIILDEAEMSQILRLKPRTRTL